MRFMSCSLFCLDGKALNPKVNRYESLYNKVITVKTEVALFGQKEKNGRIR
jgi:hypothetical protein